MGLHKLILVTVIVLLTICSLACFLERSYPDSTPVLPKETEVKMLLEVHTTLEGMVEPSGTRLDFRLFDNGEAEFSSFSTIGADGNRAGSITKRVTLTESDQSQLTSLISKDDLIGAKDEYDPTIIISDVSTTTSVWIRHKHGEKRINVRERDTTLHLNEKKGVYPQSLLELLFLISHIREKYT